jgi:DNA-binding NarL/FixJ family response regulator
MHKIFIVDDHPAVRQNYLLLLEREPGMECCGEATSAGEALTKISETSPDIVVLDISLHGAMDGVTLLQQIRTDYADLAILVVSGHDEAVYAEKILRLGARGYVMKGDALAFVKALRKVVAGGVYLSEQMRKETAAD